MNKHIPIKINYISEKYYNSKPEKKQKRVEKMNLKRILHLLSESVYANINLHDRYQPDKIGELKDLMKIAEMIGKIKQKTIPEIIKMLEDLE